MFIVQACRRAWLGFLFVSLLGLPLGVGATAHAQPEPQPAKQSDKDTEIKTLLKERRAVTERVVALLSNLYQSGRADFPKLAYAELEALKAILEGVDNSEERIAALQQYQKTAENILKFTEARFMNGATTEVDVLQAKSILLAVRIELLREEQKAKLPK